MSHVFPLRKTLPALRRLALATALFGATIGAAYAVDDDFSASAVEVVLSQGHGSGVYIGDGYVLTAAHVVERASDEVVTIRRPRNGNWSDTWSAVVLWTDQRQDFALLRIKAVVLDDLPKSVVSCTAPSMGEDVTVVGWPADLGRVRSRGYIASEVDKRGPWAVAYVMIAPISFGNSGGPVYNKKGEVIALTVGLLSGTSLSLVVPTAAICDQIPSKAKS